MIDIPGTRRAIIDQLEPLCITAAERSQAALVYGTNPHENTSAAIQSMVNEVNQLREFSRGPQRQGSL